MSTQRQPALGPTIPVLPVADVEKSLEYYTRVLGFSINWTAGEFAAVSRGKCTLFLCADQQGHAGTWVWIGVLNADEIFADMQQVGARIRQAPQNYTWGYEAHIEDLDGNVLRLSSDPRDGELGVWMRDEGERWQQKRDGSWVRAE